MFQSNFTSMSVSTTAQSLSSRLLPFFFFEEIDSWAGDDKLKTLIQSFLRAKIEFTRETPRIAEALTLKPQCVRNDEKRGLLGFVIRLRDVDSICGIIFLFPSVNLFLIFSLMLFRLRSVAEFRGKYQFLTEIYRERDVRGRADTRPIIFFVGNYLEIVS